MTPEQLGLWVGFAMTLMVFSYLLGDNVLYRLAIFVFIGLAAGFVTIVTVESVILPWIRVTVLAPDASLLARFAGILPFLLGLLLLLKVSPGVSRLGHLALAFIVGVGAAVALVGALTGTLLPLSSATSAAVATDRLNGFLIVLGVTTSVLYFQYRARRTAGGLVRQSLPTRFVRAIGHGFIVVTLGALYAGAILTGLTVFGERLAFIIGRIGGG